MTHVVSRHYAELLGPVYSWSVSRGGDPFAAAEAWLAARGLLGPGAVLDLGAGFGAHVVPLARSGSDVWAVDLDPGLTRELERNLDAESLSATVVCGDALDFLATESRTWDRVVCLGDTITHLESREEVRRLFALATARLAPGGSLWIRWRDTSGSLPEGLDRFIPVAVDATRAMHCFIEEIDAERVQVTDLVTEVRDDGLETKTSAYPKLRLSRAELAALGGQMGLAVDSSTADGGMSEVGFRQP